MTAYRSLGAGLDDDGTGTEPLDVRKDLAGIFTQAGVLPGSSSPLVQGLSGFSYQVNAAAWVTSRGASDGYHLWGNDGPVLVATDPAPGGGLSRIDIIYALHPSNGENGDTDSVPVIAVAKGTAASSPVAPTLPTGALELARNTMTSTATSTNSAGNTITQSAASSTLIDRVATLHATPDGSFPTSTTATSGTAVVHNRITIPAVNYTRILVVNATMTLTYNQTNTVDGLLYVNSTNIDHQRVAMTLTVAEAFKLMGQATLAAGVTGVVEARFQRIGGTGVVTPTLSSLSRLVVTAHPA